MLMAANSANTAGDVVIYPDLCYALNGIFFQVQNDLGTKFKEKHYCIAIAKLLDEVRIKYRREVQFTLTYHGEKLGLCKIDFIIEDCIVIEAKVVDRLTSDHFQQTLRYLDAQNLKLALLVNFRIRPLQIRRIINAKAPIRIIRSEAFASIR